ncbi:MAG: oxygen-independent coproporphyrinogen III oxidase [Methylovirgula sp.]|nr:oxygen-independent coproporphyrinogen III oxidase [Methylovirgula sp.]
MLSLYALAERNVPRYTSYPTAPHFSDAVGPETYSQWLGALKPEAELSLYIHVPYCTDICLYCGCHTKAVRRREPIDRYAERLIGEIEHVAQVLGRHRITHLHWGGGTPSILGPRWLTVIADRIGAAFDLSALVEHAIELDPRHLSAELAGALAEIGVNRASLGVQDFSPQVQKAIGRMQPFAQVGRAVGMLHGVGIENINIDLMYGLPHQSIDDVAESARLAALLSPKRIVLFGFAYVPWFKTQQKLIDAGALPGTVERLEQARVAAETLASLGYVAVGLDHFALPDDPLAEAARGGRLHRNFQGYTVDDAEALIGLGVSAISRLPQGFAQNAVDMAGYSRSLEAGRFATVKGYAFSSEDKQRAAVIERLMCDLAIDLDEVPGDYSAEIEALQPLAQNGVVAIDGRRLAITEQGRPFLRLVAAAFDAYLPAASARHSAAV